MPRKIRQIRVEGNIAYVTLTQGYEAVIDAADVSLVGGVNWCTCKGKNSVYAGRTNCYDGVQRTDLLHRVLMGEPDGMEVDHRDGDGLNNRRANLRVATKSQNMHNQGIRSTNRSGFKGVCRHKASGKWKARIALNGKERHLGYFATPEAAHLAYCKASAELHGEFGRIS